MKIQIDINVKTITIEEAISLGELFDLLTNMFPNFTWKDYLLCPVKVIDNWINPVTIPWQPAPWIYPITPNPVLPQPTTTPYPWPITICGTGTGSVTSKSGDNFTYTNGTYNLMIDKTNGCK